MAEDKTGPDLMGYEAMAQEALRGVVKAALKRAAQPGGLPGNHHLYISFRMKAPGVSAPPELAERYPDEMTIVLQHQFWDLAPGETFFAVTLKFGGSPKRMSVPYAALTRFYDPSVQFMLQFEPAEAEAVSETEVVPLRPRLAPVENDANVSNFPTPDAEADPAAPPESDGPKIVSLDTFRKKMSDIAVPVDEDRPRFTDAEILARFQASTRQPAGSVTLGFRLVRVDQAAMEVEVAFTGSPAFCNPLGGIQGGYLCAMLDDTMSVAGHVASGMTQLMPTLEMKTSFLRPAKPGQLFAVGRVLRWGRTIAFTEGDLYDAERRLLAKATATALPTPFKRG